MNHLRIRSTERVSWLLEILLRFFVFLGYHLTLSRVEFYYTLRYRWCWNVLVSTWLRVLGPLYWIICQSALFCLFTCILLDRHLWLEIGYSESDILEIMHWIRGIQLCFIRPNFNKLMPLMASCALDRRTGFRYHFYFSVELRTRVCSNGRPKADSRVLY